MEKANVLSIAAASKGFNAALNDAEKADVSMRDWAAEIRKAFIRFGVIEPNAEMPASKGAIKEAIESAIANGTCTETPDQYFAPFWDGMLRTFSARIADASCNDADVVLARTVCGRNTIATWHRNASAMKLSKVKLSAEAQALWQVCDTKFTQRLAHLAKRDPVALERAAKTKAEAKAKAVATIEAGAEEKGRDAVKPVADRILDCATRSLPELIVKIEKDGIEVNPRIKAAAAMLLDLLNANNIRSVKRREI